MEAGVNPADIMKEYHDLQTNHKKLQDKHQTYRDSADKKIKELEKKVKELRSVLKKQQEEVVKPLIQEMRINSELLERQKLALSQNAKDITMLHSIMRMPAMCDQF